jgi:Flp pilus assembly protein TadG
MMRKLLQRIRARTSGRFVRDTRGAAAVELGIITPAILGLFFGTAELADGVAVDRKVTIAARALSDLVGQATTISNADMTNIFNATTAIMTPYSASPLKARVSAVNIDASGNATVGWGDSTANEAPRKKDDPVTIPQALRIPNTQLIWSEISYGYTPAVAKYITGTLTLTEQFFAAPRQSSTICRPPAVTTCS